MINDTLHIGDIVVGAKQPFSTENRQSYLILNFAEHTETGNALIVYQEVYTGKIRCGLLETFMAKTELLLAKLTLEPYKSVLKEMIAEYPNKKSEEEINEYISEALNEEFNAK